MLLILVGVELHLCVIVTLLECCVMFSGVKLSIRSFNLLLLLLIIDNKTFLDSPFGSEKVEKGIAAIESLVLSAKVYFILHCSGSQDIALLSNNIVA